MRLSKKICAGVSLAFIANICWSESPEWIYEYVSPSIVTVLASNATNEDGAVFGSGVVVAPNKVVTNCHVVVDRTNIVVIQRKETYRVSHLKRHSFADICLLDVPNLPLPSVHKFMSVEQIKVGQRVFAIGSPAGLESTLSDGLVSGIREMYADSERLPGQMQTVIQTNAAIEHGSSGGGLFDESGALIGITTFGRSSGNQNFAVPADRVQEMLGQIPDERLARLGLEVTAGTTLSGEYRVAPRLTFQNVAAGAKWLDEMSKRAESYIPEEAIRKKLLVTVQYEATRAGLDPQLILAMIEVLSKFNKVAAGENDARGYMQIRTAWIREIGVPSQDLFNTQTNLRYGCTIFRYYLDVEKGSVWRALVRYDVERRQEKPRLATEGQFENKVFKAWNSKWDYDRSKLN